LGRKKMFKCTENAFWMIFSGWAAAIPLYYMTCVMHESRKGIDMYDVLGVVQFIGYFPIV